jgi:hypothetical protein
MALLFLLSRFSPKRRHREIIARAIRLGAAKEKKKCARRTEGRTGFRIRTRGNAGGNSTDLFVAVCVLRHGPVVVPPVEFASSHEGT